MTKNIMNFRDIHKNQRCFVIGNGPSLRNTNLDLIKDEITFGCNRIYLSEFKPTYYAIEDVLDVQQFHKEINEYEAPKYKFIPFSYKNLIKGDNVVYIKFGRGNSRINFVDKSVGYFVWGGTVTYLMIQLAYWMGCNPIYLIGIDHNWGNLNESSSGGKVIQSSEADAYHFSKKYYNEGKYWALPDIEVMERSYRTAKEILSKEGYDIFNATKDSKLNIFRRIDYNGLFSRNNRK